MTDSSNELFEEVVQNTGLSRIIARGTIRRALASVGATIETATAEDYVEAMPELTKRLAPFITQLEANRRLENLERKLRFRTGMITGRIVLSKDSGS